jgi:hypothetical protein
MDRRHSPPRVLALAAVYWFTPAGGLPSFLAGFEAGSDHVHVTRALGSLILALARLSPFWPAIAQTNARGNSSFLSVAKPS